MVLSLGVLLVRACSCGVDMLDSLVACVSSGVWVSLVVDLWCLVLGAPERRFQGVLGVRDVSVFLVVSVLVLVDVVFFGCLVFLVTCLLVFGPRCCRCSGCLGFKCSWVFWILAVLVFSEYRSPGAGFKGVLGP